MDSRIALAGAVNLVVGGAGNLCRPSPGMAAAYEQHPDLALMRLDHRTSVRELIATVLTVGGRGLGDLDALRP